MLALIAAPAAAFVPPTHAFDAGRAPTVHEPTTLQFDHQLHVPRRRTLAALSVPLLLAMAPTPLIAAQPDAATGVATPSGLKYIDFRKGVGATPRFGQLIRFHYVGYTLARDKGLKAFDSSYERKAPYFTKHGNGYTCQGIEEALHTMQPGGRRRVVMPPNLGFAIGDKGPLPPGPRQRDQLFTAVEASELLVYDLELISATDDLLDRGDYEDLDLNEAQGYARSRAPPRRVEDSGDGPMGKGL
jgi:hypothetical protein